MAKHIFNNVAVYSIGCNRTPWMLFESVFTQFSETDNRRWDVKHGFGDIKSLFRSAAAKSVRLDTSLLHFRSQVKHSSFSSKRGSLILLYGWPLVKFFTKVLVVSKNFTVASRQRPAAACWFDRWFLKLWKGWPYNFVQARYQNNRQVKSSSYKWYQ